MFCLWAHSTTPKASISHEDFNIFTFQTYKENDYSVASSGGGWGWWEQVAPGNFLQVNKTI